MLLVEGSTPLHFFEALLQHLGIADRIEIRNFRGVNELKADIAAYAKSAAFQSKVRSVGVVRDAEQDRNAAFTSVRDALDAAGLDAGNPAVRTSIYIFPDDRSPGMIETLCVEAIRSDPVFPCIEDFLQCAEQRGATPPIDFRRAKNLAQAYLATRHETQMFPGIAAYRGFWPWDSKSFDEVKAFLRTL